MANPEPPKKRKRNYVPKGRVRIGTERARELAGLRRTIGIGTGRPRSKDKVRCACGAMTLKRALARCHDCVADAEGI